MISDEHNAFSLAASLWLDDEELFLIPLLVVVHVCFKFIHFTREQLGLWEEVLKFAKLLPHVNKILG